jgi:hypothetical protein
MRDGATWYVVIGEDGKLQEPSLEPPPDSLSECRVTTIRVVNCHAQPTDLRLRLSKRDGVEDAAEMDEVVPV